jgi:molybdenum transport protein
MRNSTLTDEALFRLLKDDAPCGDLTTETSGIGQHAARLDFRARQEMGG